MTRPLAGIRVIEVGNFIAGPFAGMLLADMGADVVKIEPPGTGDLTRATPPLLDGQSAGFLAINRNKRSLALNLKKSEGVEVVLKLASESDMLLENFRPGVVDSLGIGPGQVRAVNPDLVYVSVSGFGQTGPYQRRAAVNLIVEAAAGTLSVIGEPGGTPYRPGLQTADVLGAMYATYAALSGLVGKLRHAEGRTIDVSMLEASIASAMWETSGYFATGEVPRPVGNRHRIISPYQLFETRDGYLAVGASSNHHFARLCEVLGLEEHVSNPHYASTALRKQHEAEVDKLIADAIRQRGAEELTEALVAVGVPCSPVHDYRQVFEDPQVVERGVAVEVDQPGVGPFTVVRNPILFDRDGPAIDRPAPRRGEHSREVLRGLGYPESEIDRLAAEGVVELGAC